MPLLKYEQIAESLRTRVADGEFGPGDLLPSGRDLSEQWGVSRATVVKAMDVLRNDGLVIARQGTGFAVAETPAARLLLGSDGRGPAGCPAARRTDASAPQTVRCHRSTWSMPSGSSRARRHCAGSGCFCWMTAPRTPW